MREMKSSDTDHFVREICHWSTEDRPFTEGCPPIPDTLQAEYERMSGDFCPPVAAHLLVRQTAR